MVVFLSLIPHSRPAPACVLENEPCKSSAYVLENDPRKYGGQLLLLEAKSFLYFNPAL